MYFEDHIKQLWSSYMFSLNFVSFGFNFKIEAFDSIKDLSTINKPD